MRVDKRRRRRRRVWRSEDTGIPSSSAPLQGQAARPPAHFGICFGAGSIHVWLQVSGGFRGKKLESKCALVWPLGRLHGLSVPSQSL